MMTNAYKNESALSVVTEQTMIVIKTDGAKKPLPFTHEQFGGIFVENGWMSYWKGGELIISSSNEEEGIDLEYLSPLCWGDGYIGVFTVVSREDALKRAESAKTKGQKRAYELLTDLF